MTTPLDFGRLEKLLGMLGSGHDGEVLNAARLAHRLVERAGLSWADVLGAPVLATTPPAAARPDQTDQSETGLVPGDRIYHREFGFGFVMATFGSRIEVAFDEAGMRSLFDSFVLRAARPLRPTPQSNAGFVAGNRVYHENFGYGVVVATFSERLDVDFERLGRKSLMDSFVTLATR